MKTWLVWVLVMSATDGTLVDSHPETGERMTAQECVNKLTGRMSVTREGKFEVYVCHNAMTQTQVRL